jgi:hypothetical protein
VATFSLKITFGGAVLFVHRSQRSGLAVLMPRDLKHGHRPQIIINGQNAGFLQDHTFDWRPMLTGASKLNKVNRVPNAVPFSSASGGRVPKRMFGTTKPDAVAARFLLPWPKTATAVGDMVPMGTANLSFASNPIAGRVSLVYQLDDDISIKKVGSPKPHDILAGQDQEIEIANIIKTDVTHRHYDKGHVVEHAIHYYDLLEGAGSTPPDVVTEAPYDSKVGIQWVNPVECIIGTACEEGVTKCTD